MTTATTLIRPPDTETTTDWRALPVLVAGTVMIVLDFFIVNVALPSIRSELHAGASVEEWVVAGYGLTFAVLLVVAGRLGDRYGRRRLLTIGLVLFGVTSALCGLAPSGAVLVGARLAQGAAAAMISPTVLSLIGVIYTGADRVRAISVYGVAMGLAAAGGQLLGGVLIQSDIAGLGWRSIFLVNVPVAALAAGCTGRLVPESRAEHAPRLDGTGAILLSAALSALVLPLVEGRQLGWPEWTWASLILFPVLLGVFGWHQCRLERTGGSPLLSPRLYSDPVLRRGLAVQLCFWCGQASLFLVLALYFQDGRGLGPVQAGLLFTVLAGAYLATSLRAPALTMRFGRDLIGLGAALLAVGEGALALVVAARGAHVGVAALVPGLLAAGAGMGLCITPLTSVILGRSDPEQVGSVSGAMSTMQQVGNALGVAVTGVIYFGTVHAGTATAFQWSAVQLAVLLAAVAVMTRLLPGRSREV